MNAESVSVIIPVYNGERYLQQAIDSVLNQSASSIDEIIIVDDGSEDQSAYIAKRTNKVRYFHQEHTGVSSARNLGLSKASGKFIAFLDADDRWHSCKIEKQLSIFRDQPRTDMVFTMVAQFISEDLTKSEHEKIHCPEEPMKGLIPSAAIIRADVFSKCGVFETSLSQGEFVSWYARAKEAKVKEYIIKDILTYRRLHMNNFGRRNRKSRSDYLKLLKASLDRRRVLK